MNEPTKEQIQKFWQWCGFKSIVRTDSYEVRDYKMWEAPDKTEFMVLPEPDLNNLFKYAVPKLINFQVINFSQRRNGEWKAKLWFYTGGIRDGVDLDPALALFWAIWELIECEEKEKR